MTSVLSGNSVRSQLVVVISVQFDQCEVKLMMSYHFFFLSTQVTYVAKCEVVHKRLYVCLVLFLLLHFILKSLHKTFSFSIGYD